MGKAPKRRRETAEWVTDRLAELCAAAAVLGGVGPVGAVSVVLTPADASRPPVVLTVSAPAKGAGRTPAAAGRRES